MTQLAVFEAVDAVTSEYEPYLETIGAPFGASADCSDALYGSGGQSIELASAGITLRYTTFKQISNDVDDARVYGGIHFRFDQDAGVRLGRDVATCVYKRNLRRPNDPE